MKMLYVDGAIPAKFVDASIAFVYVFFALGRAVSFGVIDAPVVNKHPALLRQRMHNQYIARAVIVQVKRKK